VVVGQFAGLGAKTAIPANGATIHKLEYLILNHHTRCTSLSLFPIVCERGGLFDSTSGSLSTIIASDGSFFRQIRNCSSKIGVVDQEEPAFAAALSQRGKDSASILAFDAAITPS
jgi:hypothetical protein